MTPNENNNKPEPTLKERFIEAIKTGQLGTQKPAGIFVTLKEFKHHFSDIETQYVSSFLPAATMESVMIAITHTKFVFRIAKEFISYIQIFLRGRHKARTRV